MLAFYSLSQKFQGDHFGLAWRWSRSPSLVSRDRDGWGQLEFQCTRKLPNGAANTKLRSGSWRKDGWQAGKTANKQKSKLTTETKEKVITLIDPLSAPFYSPPHSLGSPPPAHVCLWLRWHICGFPQWQNLWFSLPLLLIYKLSWKNSNP